MSTRKRRSKVKLIGAFITITGALVVVAAGVTLGMVSSELKAERIAITRVTTAGPPAQAHTDVFHAYAPAGLNQAIGQDVHTFPDSADAAINGSFLRALFLIAAVALGVAAPVMGVGVMFAVTGIGPLRHVSKRRPRLGRRRTSAGVAADLS